MTDEVTFYCRIKNNLAKLDDCLEGNCEICMIEEIGKYWRGEK